MRIFGFEFKRVKPPPTSESTALIVRDLVMREDSVRPSSLYFKRKNDWLEDFRYPLIDESDPWQVMVLNKYRDEISSFSSSYRSYSVCGLTDIVRALQITQTPASSASWDKLREVHCINFKLVPEVIFRQIPHLANHVISGGEITHPSIFPHPHATSSQIVDV